MQIRQATSADEEQIVALLKASLGESSSEKSIRYWRWKHVDNPFGQSPVLVAEEAGELIGVRAFMPWYWQAGEVRYRALRAVDTATHPAHQGKGIFKRLTLQLVADCQQAGYAFIFNTPNEQSRPGYLKMGWEAVGKLPVRLQIVRPFSLLRNQLFKDSQKRKTPWPGAPEPIKATLDRVAARLGSFQSAASTSLHTPVDMAYLRWRYEYCPVQRYEALYESGCLLIYYVKEQSLGRELRLAQFLQLEKGADKKPLKQALKRLKKRVGVDYVSVAPAENKELDRWLSSQFFLPALSVGPVLTYRKLQAEQEAERLGNWAYQMGDMELF